MVGGRTGGIPLQVEHGTGGFLLASVDEASARTHWLADHPPEARTLAALGRERVRVKFLITRLLSDELRLNADVIGQRSPNAVAAA